MMSTDTEYTHRNDPQLSMFTELWPILPHISGSRKGFSDEEKCDICGSSGVPLSVERPGPRSPFTTETKFGKETLEKDPKIGTEPKPVSLNRPKTKDEPLRDPKIRSDGKSAKPEPLTFFSVLWPILPHLSPELRQSFTEMMEQCENCGSPLETQGKSISRPSLPTVKEDKTLNLSDKGKKVDFGGKPAKSDDNMVKKPSLSSRHSGSVAKRSPASINRPQSFRGSLSRPSLPTVEEGEKLGAPSSPKVITPKVSISSTKSGDTKRQVVSKPAKIEDGDTKIGEVCKKPSVAETKNRPAGPTGDSPLAAVMSEIEKKVDEALNHIDEIVQKRDTIVISKHDSEIINKNMNDRDLAALFKSLEKERDIREERVRDLTTKEAQLRERLHSAVNWAKGLETAERVRA